MSNDEMRESFEAWHESRRLKIIAESDRITAEKIAEGWSDSVVTSAESTYEAIERITVNNSSFMPFQAGWQAALAQQSDTDQCTCPSIDMPFGRCCKAKIKNLEELSVDDQETMEAQDYEIRQLKLRVAEWERMYVTNRQTIDKLMSRVAELESYGAPSEELTRLESENYRLVAERDKSQSRVAELEYLEHNVIVMTGISERVAAERDKLQSELATLRSTALAEIAVIEEIEMKPTNKNTYAFPLKEPLSNDELGMTLRDYFAAKAMAALIAAKSNYDFDGYAKVSYKFADVMLAERLK